MSEARYWLRLWAACLLLGALLFYLSLKLTVKGGKVSMPDLRGLSKAAAQRKLESLGLRLKLGAERFDSQSPYGVVLEQDIEPGVVVGAGRRVELVLSRGTKFVRVPQLRGLASLRQAQLLLEQNGLSLGLVDRLADAAPPETVLAHSPEEQVEVARQTAVSLLLSKGSEPRAWIMPDLKGWKLPKARTVARAMGLVLRRVVEKSALELPPGSVIGQSLTPGGKVEQGAELVLQAVKEASGSGVPRLARIEYQMPSEGYMERRVRIVVTDDLGEHVVFNAMTKPGEWIRLESRVRGLASYHVYVAGMDLGKKEIP